MNIKDDSCQLPKPAMQSESIIGPERQHVQRNELQNEKQTTLVYVNDGGEIFKSCGKDFLIDITRDYLDLLETCTSIYEKNGNCALNVIKSSWCRHLRNSLKRSSDSISDKNSNQYGNSFETICCCKDFAEMAVKSGIPVDMECDGGFRLYSVPIKAGKESIGAINFGYGDPPKDSNSLKKIASMFCTTVEQLTNCADSCGSRPQFMIDIAKNKLLSSAGLIGSIVERKRAENALQKAYNEIERVVELRTEALTKSYNMLKKQTCERIKAETESFKMNQALELVYEMATRISVSMEEVADKIVLSISELIRVPAVVLGYLEKNELQRITQIINKELIHYPILSLESHPYGIVYREKRPVQISADLNQHYSSYMENFSDMESFFGVPAMSSKSKILGAICVLDKKQRTFSDFEKHLIEIFARYIGHEIERKEMEQQLWQSQEMKMLGQLTSGVAHEVRNPLNGILAITEALSNELSDKSDYAEYIELIRKQVMRLSDLMKDLLNLGRPIEKANMMPLTISKLISTAVTLWMQSSVYHDRQIDIKISDDAGPVQVNADRAKIEQVVINLLENACAHSSQDQGITICIQKKGKKILIKIVDNGSGIKPEYMEHLFEPFFTTRKGGTGLGLGIVKRIVESHGGSIEISNNTPPPGVTAEVYLPVIETAYTDA